MHTCLIVTGDTAVRDVIRVGLAQTQSFDVRTANDDGCLERLTEEPVDLVVADTSLGDGGDGLDFLRRVREACPHTELALLTRGRADNRLLSRDKHRTDIATFFRVPVQPEEFFRSVRRLLDRLAQRAEHAAA